MCFGGHGGRFGYNIFEHGPYGCPEVVTQPCCSSNAKKLATILTCNKRGPDTVNTAKRSNDQNLKSVSEKYHSIYI